MDDNLSMMSLKSGTSAQQKRQQQLPNSLSGGANRPESAASSNNNEEALQQNSNEPQKSINQHDEDTMDVTAAQQDKGIPHEGSAGRESFASAFSHAHTEKAQQNWDKPERKGDTTVAATTDKGIPEDLLMPDVDILHGKGNNKGNIKFRSLVERIVNESAASGTNRIVGRIMDETQGRFLKQDEATGLWHEIPDDQVFLMTKQQVQVAVRAKSSRESSTSANESSASRHGKDATVSNETQLNKDQQQDNSVTPQVEILDSDDTEKATVLHQNCDDERQQSRDQQDEDTIVATTDKGMPQHMVTPEVVEILDSDDEEAMVLQQNSQENATVATTSQGIPEHALKLDVDVLYGKAYRLNQGNRKFLALATKVSNEVASSHALMESAASCDSIARIIINEAQGRFLRKDGATGLWHQVAHGQVFLETKALLLSLLAKRREESGGADQEDTLGQQLQAKGTPDVSVLERAKKREGDKKSSGNGSESSACVSETQDATVSRKTCDEPQQSRSQQDKDTTVATNVAQIDEGLPEHSVTREVTTSDSSITEKAVVLRQQNSLQSRNQQGEDTLGVTPLVQQDKGVPEHSIAPDVDFLCGKRYQSNKGNIEFFKLAQKLLNDSATTLMDVAAGCESIDRIARRIVNEAQGRFLRKDEATGLWHQIPDGQVLQKTKEFLLSVLERAEQRQKDDDNNNKNGFFCNDSVDTTVVLQHGPQQNTDRQDTATNTDMGIPEHSISPDVDVLWGKAYRFSKGNTQFLILAKKILHEYVTLADVSVDRIARRLIMETPGRFLRIDEATGLWYPVPDGEIFARTKELLLSLLESAKKRRESKRDISDSDLVCGNHLRHDTGSDRKRAHDNTELPTLTQDVIDLTGDDSDAQSVHSTQRDDSQEGSLESSIYDAAMQSTLSMLTQYAELAMNEAPASSVPAPRTTGVAFHPMSPAALAKQRKRRADNDSRPGKRRPCIEIGSSVPAAAEKK